MKRWVFLKYKNKIFNNYLISTKGDIYNITTSHFTLPRKKPNRNNVYSNVRIDGKMKSIETAKLVLYSFDMCSNIDIFQEKYGIIYKDGNKENFNLYNFDYKLKDSHIYKLKKEFLAKFTINLLPTSNNTNDVWKWVELPDGRKLDKYYAISDKGVVIKKYHGRQILKPIMNYNICTKKFDLYYKFYEPRLDLDITFPIQDILVSTFIYKKSKKKLNIKYNLDIDIYDLMNKNLHRPKPIENMLKEVNNNYDE